MRWLTYGVLGALIVAGTILMLFVGSLPTRRYESFIALRYIKSKRRSFISVITFFSVFGVVLGVSMLATVVSVTGGFQEAFRDKVLGINSHILVMKYGINYREYRDTIKDVEAIPGVEAASPFIFHEMMVNHDNKLSNVLIKGIDPDRVERVSDLPKYVREGSIDGIRWEPPAPDKAADPAAGSPDDGPPKPDEPGGLVDGPGKEPSMVGAGGPLPGILLGGELASKLDVKVGDTVTIVSPLRGLDPNTWAPTQMAPTGRDFRVAGIYRSGFFEYDTKLVMVDYRALQDFFNQGDSVTGIEIRVTDVFAVGEIGKSIRAELPPGRFRTLDWREINRNLFTSLKLQKLALAIILTFIVIVASINIVNTLIMSVLDKAKEISILKSMGATDGGIMKIFIMQGMVIGGIGTALGLLGGFGLCILVASIDLGMDPQVYLIDKLPVKMQLWEFGVIAVVSLTICFTATLYPAWRAARLPPVEGLRFE